jgi:hypothetical protein
MSKDINELRRRNSSSDEEEEEDFKDQDIDEPSNI